MTEAVQRFLLKNTGFLQNLVNNKLAKRPGGLGRVFTWLEIGPRNYGQHIIPKYFRLFNAYFTAYGIRMNWCRPHITKTLMTREREVYLVGYGGVCIIWAWWARKNRIRPLYRQNDAHLNEYDNPSRFSTQFNMMVPSYYASQKVSAHYLEINKIFSREMSKKFLEYQAEVELEFKDASERTRRTKYLGNPNYVYEKFGWES